jgi:hypothetical protein
MIGKSIQDAVENEIVGYSGSRLAQLTYEHGPYAIKFVQSKWANHYSSPKKLKISETPALTWGTATYVTPLVFPLSSALYGRIGLVTDFDPSSWKIFDATKASARSAYVRWARSQPSYAELLLTVHSTQANHVLRNQFRERFKIDCVLFNPDQEAEIHTDRTQHVWMAVTDWTAKHKIATKLSKRLSNARFTVLLDEDFLLEDQGLPIKVASRQIEKVTEKISRHSPIEVGRARQDKSLPSQIVQFYQAGGYLHVYIKP